MKRNISKSFFRIIPTLLIISVIGTLSVITQRNLLKSEENRCWQRLYETADYVHDATVLVFENNVRTLRLISSAITGHGEENISLDACINQLKEYQSLSSLSRIDLLYPDDTMITQSGDQIANAGIPFSQIALKGECYSNPTIDPITGKRIIAYYVPVVQNGTTTAAICGIIECDRLPQLLKTTAYGEQARISIVNRADGAMILDGWETGAESLFELNGNPLAQEYQNLDLIAEIRSGQSGAVSYETQNNKKISYMVYVPFEQYNWELLCFVPEDVAFAGLQDTNAFLFHLGIMEVIVILLYVLWNMFNLYRLNKRKHSSDKQLLVSNTLIACIKELSSYTDIHTAIQNLLGTLNHYFDGDRTYLFELDYEKQTTSNTYEYTSEGVSKEIDNLQNIPLEVITGWIRKFEEKGTFYISHIDKDVYGNSETYDILDAQGIESLVAVPLIENNVIIGFLGVDNPKKNYRDLSLLSSTTFFIMDSLERRKYQELLERLSFEDALTKLHNRNKFNQVTEQCRTSEHETLGVAYFDLNGLKSMNDKLGHRAGDAFIQNTASIIRKEFGSHAFRIGGDEFTVILPGISEVEFRAAIDRISNEFKEKDMSVSIGVSWAGSDNDIEAQLHHADSLMYEDKQRFYSTLENDRRKAPR